MSDHNRRSWWPTPSAFVQRLRDGTAPPVALWATLGSASVVELLAAHRPDALLLDREHSTTSLGDVQVMILAAGNAGVPVLVRVPGPDPDEVGRLLDAGADGIVFPRVSNAAQARAAARSVRYPPGGTRGWAGTHARRSAWGGAVISPADGGPGDVLSPAFVQAADAAVATIFMIEDPEGASGIEDILEAGNPDAVIFGWGDFTVAVGFDTAVVKQARARVHDACRRRGVGVALGTSAQDLADYYPGCFVAAGVEAALFSTAVADQLAACREFGQRMVREKTSPDEAS